MTAPLNMAVPSKRPMTRLADTFDHIRQPSGSSRLGNYSDRSFLAAISPVVAIMQGQVAAALIQINAKHEAA